MTEQNKRITSLLIRHEGMKLRAYFCPAGKITIGVGRNLEDNGISEEEALYLLENDIIRIRLGASRAFEWFRDLSEVRQEVVISMIFNLGFSKFADFRGMIAALSRGDFDRAASEMLSSRWAGQVGKRAAELADMMRTG